MTTAELKRQIEQQTGLPSSLLTAETAGDLLAQARDLLEYKAARFQQSTPGKFAEWLAANLEPAAEPQETEDALQALHRIAAALQPQSEYPALLDKGELDVTKWPDPAPARDQFAEYFHQATAFDPKSPWTDQLE